MRKFGIKKQTFCENSYKGQNTNFLTDLLQFFIGKPGTRECITLAVKLRQNGQNFAKKMRLFLRNYQSFVKVIY